MTDNTQLLREYVRSLLKEDDAYGGFDVSSGNGSPYGMSFGSDHDLYNVFVKPFTDVVDTAVGKTKELSQKTQTLAKVAFESLATTLIPTLSSDYQEIFANDKEQMDKLKAQYKDIYDATWTAFKDNDIAMAAFMYSPSAMITAKVAQQLPIQTVKVLNTLAGGKLDSFLAKLVKKLKLGDEKKPLDRDSGEGLPEGVQYRTLAERHDIGELLSQKKIKQVVNDNPRVSQMSQHARAIVNKSLNAVLQRAQAVSKATSIQDLEHKTGKKFKGADKLAQVPEQERATLEKTLLHGARQSVMKLYITGLEKQVQGALKAGVPNDHPYIQQFQGAISKLKAM